MTATLGEEERKDYHERSNILENLIQSRGGFKEGKEGKTEGETGLGDDMMGEQLGQVEPGQTGLPGLPAETRQPGLPSLPGLPAIPEGNEEDKQPPSYGPSGGVQEENKMGGGGESYSAYSQGQYSGKVSFDSLKTKKDKGLYKLDEGSYEDALKYLTENEQKYKKKGETHKKYLEARRCLANFYKESGQFPKAIEEHKKIITILTTKYETDKHEEVAKAEMELADIYLLSGNDEDCLGHYEIANDCMEGKEGNPVFTDAKQRKALIEKLREEIG